MWGRISPLREHSRCGTTHQERSTSLVCRWCQRLTHQRPLSVAPTPPPSPPSLLMRMKLAPLCVVPPLAHQLQLPPVEIFSTCTCTSPTLALRPSK
ncbi:ORF2 [White spot syndrome virus]|uniref:ORF2 n=1 Tax=White spot syndrome virus TaxID=342409 RepID=A0A2D3I5M5_9VIRU|nr:ORF2 [White spot syndrome virus]